MPGKKRKDMNELIALYEYGYSCSEIGKIYGVSRQSVWEALNIRGVKFRETALLPVVTYNGLKFTISKTTRYYRQTNSRKKHVSLHCYIWECEVGPIPKGYDIHHEDFDRTNNVLSNLRCLPKAEHTRLHQLLKSKSK